MNAAASSAEAAFEELSEWLARELSAARGSPAESAVLEEGVRRYAAIRQSVEPSGPYEYVVHFFGADGVGLEKPRTPALQRVPDATADEVSRWSACVGEHAHRMSSAEAAAKRAPTDAG